LNVFDVNDVRLTAMLTAEPSVPEPGPFEFQNATGKLKMYKSPGFHQIRAEWFKKGAPSEIHKHIHSIWNKEEFSQQRKVSTIVPTYKKDDKIDGSYCRDISLLPTTYKITSNIILLKLTSCVEEIIGDHLCGIPHNRSTSDQIFCIRQILEKIGKVMGQYIIHL
jgi:sorting nexin-29